MAFILFGLGMKVVNFVGNIEKNISRNMLLAVNVK